MIYLQQVCSSVFIFDFCRGKMITCVCSGLFRCFLWCLPYIASLSDLIICVAKFSYCLYRSAWPTTKLTDLIVPLLTHLIADWLTPASSFLSQLIVPRHYSPGTRLALPLYFGAPFLATSRSSKNKARRHPRGWPYKGIFLLYSYKNVIHLVFFETLHCLKTSLSASPQTSPSLTKWTCQKKNREHYVN